MRSARPGTRRSPATSTPYGRVVRVSVRLRGSPRSPRTPTRGGAETAGTAAGPYTNDASWNARSLMRLHEECLRGGDQRRIVRSRVAVGQFQGVLQPDPGVDTAVQRPLQDRPGGVLATVRHSGQLARERLERGEQRV